MLSMMTKMIVHAFETCCGKWQENKPLKQRTAFKMTFAKQVPEGEDGYRDYDLILYAPMDYVQVWVRERWDVIPLDHLEYDEDGNGMVKPGCDYIKGEGPWILITNHDSCWRDGVREFLSKKNKEIKHLTGFGAWTLIPAYEVPEWTPETRPGKI